MAKGRTRQRDWAVRTPEQDELILKNLKLARFCARKVARKIGHELEVDELEGEAFLRLVIVAGGFKPELGFKFSTFAVNAIIRRLWRFMNEWREITLTRRERIKKGLDAEVRKTSIDYEIPGADSIRFKDALVDTREDALKWMERLAMRSQIMDLMRRARLTPSEKKYVTKVYLDGVDQGTVARKQGTTRQAVNQGIKLALEKLIALAKRDEFRA